jgi:mitogen-activated protein kinase 1/3
MKRGKTLNLNKFSDWEVGTDYEVQKSIGSGSYGTVAKAVHKPTGTKVAIKKVDNVFEDPVDCKRILREISILKSLKNKFVVGLFDLIAPVDREKFDSIYIVLSLAESDLKKVIKSAIFLEQKHIDTVVYNLLCGLNYIHSAQIVHRDLKPANILINEDCSVQLADFGLSRSLKGIQSQTIDMQVIEKLDGDEERKDA